MTVGNVTVSDRDAAHVELTLNTFRAGQPHAIFLRRELPGLIELLKSHVAAPEAPSDDGLDMI